MKSLLRTATWFLALVIPNIHSLTIDTHYACFSVCVCPSLSSDPMSHRRPECSPLYCGQKPLLHLHHSVETALDNIRRTTQCYRKEWEGIKTKKQRQSLLGSFNNFVYRNRDWKVDGPMFTDGTCLDADVIESHRKVINEMLETEQYFLSFFSYYTSITTPISTRVGSEVTSSTVNATATNTTATSTTADAHMSS